MSGRQLSPAFRAVLACPSCFSSLVDREGGAEVLCSECGTAYPILEGVPILLREATREHFDEMRRSWKDDGIVSPTTRLAHFVAPAVHRPRFEQRRNAELLAGLDADAIVVDIGRAVVSSDPRVCRLDMGPFHLADVVGDAHRLPFHDAALDGIYIHRVLEHVTDPYQVVREISRVLKPGAFVSAIVPFMEPFHRNPIDNLRFGRDATARLFDGFQDRTVEIWAGPTAAMLWMFKEYVAIVCPGSSHGLFYGAVRETVGWLTYPLILLDGWAKRRRYAHKIACEFRVVAFK